jgi:hypothetical protein
MCGFIVAQCPSDVCFSANIPPNFSLPIIPTLWSSAVQFDTRVNGDTFLMPGGSAANGGISCSYGDEFIPCGSLASTSPGGASTMLGVLFAPSWLNFFQ